MSSMGWSKDVAHHGKDLDMRTHLHRVRWLTCLLLALLVVANAVPTLVTARQESQGDRANVLPPTAHPIIGSWLATMGGQTGRMTFGADGSVKANLAPLQYSAPGAFQASPAIGAWEEIGETGATLTVVQRFWDERSGASVGTATITGYVAIDPAGTTLTDDGTLTTITLRNAEGSIVSVEAADANAPFLTATRLAVGENRAHPGGNDILPEKPTTAPQGLSGCATCR
jgi:hypothetical protein